jgi:hypothetical protein
MDDRYAIADTPIAIPISLRRSQLSQMINHLLGLCTIVCLPLTIPFFLGLFLFFADHDHRSIVAAPNVAFDFLIGGNFLRSTLQKSLSQLGLSAVSAPDHCHIPHLRHCHQ